MCFILVDINDTMVAEAQISKNKDLKKICPMPEVGGDCYTSARVAFLISQLWSFCWIKFLNLKLNYSGYMLFKLFQTDTSGIYQWDLPYNQSPIFFKESSTDFSMPVKRAWNGSFYIVTNFIKYNHYDGLHLKYPGNVK